MVSTENRHFLRRTPKTLMRQIEKHYVGLAAATVTEMSGNGVLVKKNLRMTPLKHHIFSRIPLTS